LGISHRRFLGWDGEGSEWSEREQDKMLALKHFEDTMLCPLCGGLLSECTDIENEMAYKVDPPTRCHKTTAILRAQDDWEERPRNRALMLGARLVKR